MANADVGEVTQLIKGVSFFPTKAKNVIATSRILVEHHGGEVPKDFDALVALPGVGRKTANVVLSNAFGVPAIPVDTHVFRVANRLGLADSPNVEGTETDLQKHIPIEQWADAHHWLIWHGREICKAPTPKCEVCFLTTWCQYYNRQGKWKNESKAAKPSKPAKAPKAKKGD
jgi:endonuclease-3